MNVYAVHVAVALRRPPVEDQWRRYLVAAVDETEARLVALQMASRNSVMPVRADVVDIVGGVDDAEVHRLVEELRRAVVATRAAA